MLARGIGAVDSGDALRHALGDTKATFACLSQQPPPRPPPPAAVARRVSDANASVDDFNLPPPPDGNKLYSFHQAMSIIGQSSKSRLKIIDEMIRRELVPLKRAMMFRHVNAYVGVGKPEAPLLRRCAPSLKWTHKKLQQAANLLRGTRSRLHRRRCGGTQRGNLVIWR